MWKILKLIMNYVKIYQDNQAVNLLENVQKELVGS